MFDIHHNFIVKAPAEEVFEAFTAPHGLDSWWTLKSDGRPDLHESYVFYFGPPYDWRAQVIHSEPPRSLTWQMTQAMDDWMGTTVGFELTESNGNTHVHFFHKGWAAAGEHFGITTYCWGQLLHGLKKYVEEGIVIPQEKRNEI